VLRSASLCNYTNEESPPQLYSNSNCSQSKDELAFQTAYLVALPSSLVRCQLLRHLLLPLPAAAQLPACQSYHWRYLQEQLQNISLNNQSDN
jgi:hypothetical protein